MADHRDDQPLGRGHGQPDVAVRVDDDRPSTAIGAEFQRGVEQRVPAQAAGDGGDEEGADGRLDAGGRQPPPGGQQAGGVDLVEGGEVRDLRPRPGHGLGRQPPDPPQWMPARLHPPEPSLRTGVPHRGHGALRNAGCSRGGGGGFDVSGENPAAGAAANDRGQVDPEIEGQLAGGRGRLRPGRGRWRGGGWDVGCGGDRCRRVRSRLGHVDAVSVLEDHEDLADFHDVAGGEGQGDDLAGDRGGQLDQSLVGLDLDQRLVACDRVARGHQPGDDLALLEAFADVRQREVDASHQARSPQIRRAAATTRAGSGT